ncbi:hypothetical protein [Acanthopleuribacter pedis]|uniref:Uncharacterized protein n=1 Tax=Acanthopleuribacter pedis TaxID=442870 RepID=A0A8J7Q557_9BACT|nr:hypothetical protein [Acanthopleuribacter pedis]MBO1318312.1 hypothetical protein [Acanthopleuribacter pedis]
MYVFEIFYSFLMSSNPEINHAIGIQADPLLRTWEEDGFRLEVFDTHQTRNGKNRLAYRLFDRHFDEIPIFEGDDFCASPLDAIDSEATIAALLNFLSLRPGDTDETYFDDYSARQREWCDLRAEALAQLTFDLRSALDQEHEFSDSD